MVGWWPQLKPRITHHACTVGFHVILHNEWSVLISAALIVRLGRRRGHSRFSRGLQRAVCSLRGWKTRLLASIFLKSGNRTRGRGRMKNRPKNRKLPDFRISGKNLNSGKTEYTKRQLISTGILWGINFENLSITVEPGRNGVTCGGFVKMHPNGCFCSEGSLI